MMIARLATSTLSAVTLLGGAVLLTLVSPTPAADKPEAKLTRATVVLRALELPSTPWNYSNLPLPDHFKTAQLRRNDNTPSNNPITDDGATLGRVLFYDTTLSLNGKTACASCHLQSHAFAEPKALSVGFEGKKVNRNAMSLINLRYNPTGRFFWDERARTLEQQVLMPIENKIEMGHNLKDLVRQLSNDPIYPPLFQKAFGDSEVTQERLARALAQFLRSIVSYRSKYDQVWPRLPPPARSSRTSRPRRTKANRSFSAGPTAPTATPRVAEDSAVRRRSSWVGPATTALTLR